MYKLHFREQFRAGKLGWWRVRTDLHLNCMCCFMRATPFTTERLWRELCSIVLKSDLRISSRCAVCLPSGLRGSLSPLAVFMYHSLHSLLAACRSRLNKANTFGARQCQRIETICKHLEGSFQPTSWATACRLSSSPPRQIVISAVNIFFLSHLLLCVLAFPCRLFCFVS